MGFLSELGKAASGEPAGDRVRVAGHPLVCSHCGGERFFRSEAQLNTAGMTFLNLDWANRTATIFECTACGRVEWFVG